MKFVRGVALVLSLLLNAPLGGAIAYVVVGYLTADTTQVADAAMKK